MKDIERISEIMILETKCDLLKKQVDLQTRLFEGIQKALNLQQIEIKKLVRNYDKLLRITNFNNNQIIKLADIKENIDNSTNGEYNIGEN